MFFPHLWNGCPQHPGPGRLHLALLKPQSSKTFLRMTMKRSGCSGDAPGSLTCSSVQIRFIWPPLTGECSSALILSGWHGGGVDCRVLPRVSRGLHWHLFLILICLFSVCKSEQKLLPHPHPLWFQGSISGLQVGQQAPLPPGFVF